MLSLAAKNHSGQHGDDLLRFFYRRPSRRKVDGRRSPRIIDPDRQETGLAHFLGFKVLSIVWALAELAMWLGAIECGSRDRQFSGG